MLYRLAHVGPLIVAVDATTWNHYLGGIIQYHCGIRLNHAVQIVGYDLTGRLSTSMCYVCIYVKYVLYVHVYVLYVLSMCCMCISVNVYFKSVFKNEIYFQLHVPVCSCTCLMFCRRCTILHSEEFMGNWFWKQWVPLYQIWRKCVW